MDDDGIESLLRVVKRFPPRREFAEKALVNDEKVYGEAARDFEAFWERAAEELHWFRRWSRVLDDTKAPFYRWFTGGEINITYNCLDRHVNSWRKNKAAIIWEGEPGDRRVLTYLELLRRVNRFANVLKGLGVGKGDRVTIYMGMVPELPIAMLACARIGAVHSIVFGGFSAKALNDRINDCEAKVVITQDGAYRRGRVIPLKDNVDEALKEAPGVESVVVLKRAGNDVRMQEGRDFWWSELEGEASAECEALPLESEHPLFILYTSGTTGKPKGVLHVHGGYNVGVHLTAKWVFDLKDEDIFWCTADIGWVTGHSYVVYGMLSNGTTVVMYEGAPDYPTPARWWEIIERYGVSILYTAPTAIRYFMKLDDEWVKKHDLSTLRLIGTVGEPINPRAWLWYYEVVGGGRCPIVDTWWQTETGMIMITPLPGVSTLKPGSANKPFPGVFAGVVDEKGEEAKPNVGGELVIKKPWPAMLRTVWGDPERYVKTYFPKGSVYITGDGARVDEEGDFWIMGRIDDVINVSGHRLGTMEVESALVSHESVAEAAVVGRRHEIKGQAIVAFVVLREGVKPTPELREELRRHVAKEIGPIAKPEEIHFVSELPKTRSGKIMRRIMRALEEGREIGDISTLEDVKAIEEIKKRG